MHAATMGALALAVACGDESASEPRTVAGEPNTERGGTGDNAPNSAATVVNEPEAGSGGTAATSSTVSDVESPGGGGQPSSVPEDSGGRGGSGGRVSSGGAATGGVATGGAATGGVATGGAATGGAGGGTTAEPTVDQMLTMLGETVVAYCAAAASCCSERGVPTALDDCESMYAMVQPAVPAIVEGAVTLDLEALERCRAAYEGPERCNLNAVVAACGDVFVGLRTEDEVCHGAYDCDRSQGATTCLVSDSSNGVLTGVCKPVPRGVLGGPCFSTCQLGYDCSASTTQGATEAGTLCYEEDGLFCEYGEAGSVCQALVPLGEPCTNFDQCGAHGRCDGTCQPLAALGEPCGSGCQRLLECGDGGTCVDPTWATEYGCSGHAPVP